MGLRVAKQLTHNCKCAYDEIRSLGLSNSVPEKLAKLVLHWAEHPLELSAKKPHETAIRVTLTQEEIAQLTGTSRETVSRVLTGFRKKRLAQDQGRNLDDHEQNRTRRPGYYMKSQVWVTFVTAEANEQAYKMRIMNTTPLDNGALNELYAELSAELRTELASMKDP